jgi:hypothetical protein
MSEDEVAANCAVAKETKSGSSVQPIYCGDDDCLEYNPMKLVII